MSAVNAAFSTSSSTIATARPFAMPAPLFKVRLECNQFVDHDTRKNFKWTGFNHVTLGFLRSEPKDACSAGLG